MKALILASKKSLQLCQLPEPEVLAGETLIDIQSAGIGGSEYLGFNNPGIRPLPSIMGHGFVGTTQAGQRVAVYPLTGCGECEYCCTDQLQLCDHWSLIGVQRDGGFAQRIAVPEKAVFVLPAELSWEQAVFIEPFANSVNAWERAGAAATDSIAVIGSGSLGLGLVALARQAGCEVIHVRDLSEQRMRVAGLLGANGRAGPEANRYDVVFDTVGSVEARRSAVSITCKGGRCVFMGFAAVQAELAVSEVVRQQKTLLGAFVYSTRQFEQAITLAACCQDDWVTNVSFEEVEGCLNTYLAGNFDTVKAALRPNGEG